MKTLRNTLLAAATLAAGTASASTRTITLPNATVRGANLTSSSISVDSDSSRTIVSAKAVAILGAHDEYMTCESGGGGDANINRTAIGSWETFIMLTFADGQVAFRTRSGAYLQATNGGGSYVTCKGSWAHGWERWTRGANSDGTYSLRASNGNYMTAESSGDLTSNRTAMGSWEKLSIIDLGAAGMDATPAVTLKFKDINGDGNAELILILGQEDGRGFLMTDPLGMFDTLDKLGYGYTNGLDFWNALSPTQRAGLHREVTVGGIDYGPTIDGPELRAFLARMPTSSTRTYATTEYAEVIDSTAASAGTCDDTGTLCATASFADTSVYIGSDGFSVDETYASASVSAGVLTVSVSTTELQAAAMVDKNGFTFGGEVTLIGVETGLGNPNGSYIGISAGLSEGFYTSAAWGKNNQYGFSIDVPVFPIGLSIYVKGSDAANLWDDVSGWSVSAAGTVASGTTAAWNDSVTWVQNAGSNIEIALAEGYHDTKSTLAKTGNDVVAGVSDATDDLVKVYANASGAVSSTVSSISSTVTSVANGVANAVSSAANTVANTATSVVDDVGSFFSNLF